MADDYEVSELTDDEEGEDVLQRRLRAFVPARTLRFSIVRAVDFEVADMHAEYGFAAGSKQANFLRRARNTRRVVAMLHDDPTGAPTHLAASTVVARVFGELRTIRRSSVFELWYVGVRRAHPLNDSAHGTRWGVHGISLDTSKTKARWRTRTGTALTTRNAARHVRGTPNPYATECVVQIAVRLACTSIVQNPEIPCAQLFEPQWSHRSHPAILLIYEALEFQRVLGYYAWYGTREQMLRRWARVLEFMKRGESVVV